jgi:hypothetical protein
MIICGFCRSACPQPRSCRKEVVGQPFAAGSGTYFIVRDIYAHRKSLLALLLAAPLMAGCSGGGMGDMLQSDLLSRDANWFSRTGRLTINNVSIDAPPLTPTAPVTSDDLVTAEGYCSGMAPPPAPTDANALTDNTAGAPPAAAPPPIAGHVALGHTECDVVRGIGQPVSVNLSSNPGGGRVAVITYLQGPRAGIYTFSGGRLSSVERAPVVEQPKPVKPAKKVVAKKKPQPPAPQQPG